MIDMCYVGIFFQKWKSEKKDLTLFIHKQNFEKYFQTLCYYSNNLALSRVKCLQEEEEEEDILLNCKNGKLAMAIRPGQAKRHLRRWFP